TWARPSSPAPPAPRSPPATPSPPTSRPRSPCSPGVVSEIHRSNGVFHSRPLAGGPGEVVGRPTVGDPTGPQRGHRTLLVGIGVHPLDVLAAELALGGGEGVRRDVGDQPAGRGERPVEQLVGRH